MLNVPSSSVSSLQTVKDNTVLAIEAPVQIVVYNMQGREIVSLLNGNMDAGYHSVVWNADANASGIYFVKMLSGGHVKTQKLMLVK